MQVIVDAPASIPIIEASIRHLHALLLAQSEKDRWHAGQYKTMPNSVAAFDERGRQVGVVFETSSPADTAMNMHELVEWTSAELRNGVLHPLLVIGVFAVVFLEIHPFQDGNGQLSRLLTNLLLLQHGYTYVPYSSLESIVEESNGSRGSCTSCAHSIGRSRVSNSSSLMRRPSPGAPRTSPTRFSRISWRLAPHRSGS